MNSSEIITKKNLFHFVEKKILTFFRKENIITTKEDEVIKEISDIYNSDPHTILTKIYCCICEIILNRNNEIKLKSIIQKFCEEYFQDNNDYYYDSISCKILSYKDLMDSCNENIPKHLKIVIFSSVCTFMNIVLEAHNVFDYYKLNTTKNDDLTNLKGEFFKYCIDFLKLYFSEYKTDKDDNDNYLINEFVTEVKKLSCDKNKKENILKYILNKS